MRLTVCHGIGCCSHKTENTSSLFNKIVSPPTVSIWMYLEERREVH